MAIKMTMYVSAKMSEQYRCWVWQSIKILPSAQYWRILGNTQYPNNNIIVTLSIYHYRLIVLLILVVRNSASDCLEDHLRNDLQCVEWDVKPYSLTHSLTDLSYLEQHIKTKHLVTTFNSTLSKKASQIVPVIYWSTFKILSLVHLAVNLQWNNYFTLEMLC